jgi:hypothetical protein
MSPEHELALIVAAGSQRRAACRSRLEALAAASDPQRLCDVLERQRLISLAAARLEQACIAVPDEMARRAERAAAVARATALDAEMATMRVAAALRAAGIRAMPLKGVTLARRLYGDPGLRPSVDVDLLVGQDDLRRAGELIESLGYSGDGRTIWEGGRPQLHVGYSHPLLPPLELHWRVHWHETGFSARMLAAAAEDPDGLLAPAPEHELAALLVFYARDGLSGLRYVADVVTVRESLPGGAAPPDVLATAGDAGLAPALTAAAISVQTLTGTRLLGGERGRRPGGEVARAVRLSDWRLASSDNQVRANAMVVDLLVAPDRAARAAWLRRHIALPDAVTRVRRGLPAAPRARVRLATAEHALRVLRRFAIAIWRLRGGRWWDAR